MSCYFCTINQSSIIDSNDHGMVVRDGYPISLGHCLVISKRHIQSFFELTIAERGALMALLEAAKLTLDAEYHPDGYNIGINDGAEAGQTIPHLHIHLIPRYQGDCEDPRGGVRWIVPHKAKYWMD